MDWDKLGDVLEVWGMENDEISYQRFEWLFVPCNYLHREFGDTGDTLSDKCIANKTAQEEYIGNMRVIVLIDEDVFQQTEFGDASVQRQSRFYSWQADQKKPSWVQGFMRTNIIKDETDFLQYGQEEENEIYTFEWPAPLPSAWIHFPTEENPSTKYKFISVEFNYSPHITTWARSTYSFLDWLGDLGGLFDALLYGCKFLLIPFSDFTLRTKILT